MNHLLNLLVPRRALRWGFVTLGFDGRLETDTPCRNCGTVPVEVTTLGESEPRYLPACPCYWEERPWRTFIADPTGQHKVEITGEVRSGRITIETEDCP